VKTAQLIFTTLVFAFNIVVILSKESFHAGDFLVFNCTTEGIVNIRNTTGLLPTVSKHVRTNRFNCFLQKRIWFLLNVA
jgi:hypothetical protein